MHLVGSSPHARIAGINPLPGITNYLLGKDQRAWRTNVPHFQRIRYENVYPGTDLIFYGNPAQLEFDFILAPGSDLSKILFTITGAARPHLDNHGNLVLGGAHNEIQFHQPALYQQDGASSGRISGRYIRRGKDSFGFSAGNYDHSKPLIIDPSIIITYTTFLGGLGDDQANGLAVDSSGNIYIGGSTTSASTFPELGPTTQGAGGGLHDLFFAKINPSSSGAASLVYLTFVGGDADDSGGYVAVDAQGDLAFLGSTTSLNFPVTDSSFFQNGPTAAVVGELNPSGNGLVFATYLDGGDGAVMTQLAGGIALDSAGDVYVTTDTTSDQLPVTAGAFEPTYGGGATDGILAEYDPTGLPLYLTYFGINATVVSSGIAVDSAGIAYIAGSTSLPAKSSFPAVNPTQAAYGGGNSDAFVMKLNPAGAGAGDLLYASLLGGSDVDQGIAIAVDSANPPSAYLTGFTRSSNFPTNGTVAALGTKAAGGNDAFLSVLSPGSGGTLLLSYSTYLGGAKDDSGTAIAALAPSAVYVAGKTASHDFPVSGSLQSFSGLSDVFLSKFDVTLPGAASLIYSTLLAGTDLDEPHSLAAAASGAIYIAGAAHSSDYPLAAHPSNGIQLNCSNCGTATGLNDAFLTKIVENLPPTAIVSFSAVNLNFGLVPVGSSGNPQNVALINSGTAALNVFSITITGANAADFAVLSSGSACPVGVFQLSPGKQCTLTVSFTPSLGSLETAAININDDLAGSPQSLSLLGSGSAPLAQISPASLDFGSIPLGASGNAQSVTFTNSGNIALTFSGIIVAGADASDFVPTGNTCSIAPGSLPAGASCNVSLNFKPVAGGARNAELDFTDNSANTPGSLQTVFLAGTGTLPAPIASVFPVSHDFGALPVGTTTLQTTITLTNTGSQTLNISGIQISGNSDYSLATGSNPSCALGTSSTLAPNANCNVTVAFHPSASGSETAQVIFTDNSGNAVGSTQVVNLSGSGLPSVVSISPPAVTVPPQLVGTSSAATPVTVKNTGGGALAFQVAISGSNASDFSENDNCAGSVSPGTSCNLMITFAPKAPGTRNGMLIVTETNMLPANNQQTVPLGGSAIDFALGVANGSATTATVVAGQAAAFNLQVNPISGFTGPVVLSCSGAPPSASCAAAPASINVTGNSAVPFTLNIGTSAAQPAIPLEKHPWPFYPAGWLLLALFASFFSLVVLPEKRRLILGISAPAAALLVLLLISGCGGGGGSSNTASAGPPRGTFTIVVNGTSQGGNRSVSLTLTIQ